MDYETCARKIYDALGGSKNIKSVTHCATRLRLVLIDDDIDISAIENIDGVSGVFWSMGQIHIVIGVGSVNKVYESFVELGDVTEGTKEKIKAEADKKIPLLRRMIRTLGDVFVPILPAIVASGLMMGIVESAAKISPAFANSDWFELLDLISGTAFAFLPVLIAISVAKTFGGNSYLGAIIGMIMVHPNLINAWKIVDVKTAQVPTWNLAGIIQIKQVGYQGHVIPVIIAVWLMCKLEKWLHRRVPNMIDIFVTPLITVMITALAVLTIIGPVFSRAETYILAFASWIITVGHGVGAMLMGALYPLTVVFGIHHMYNMIETGMLAQPGGLNTWMPIASAANFAQAAACLAVGIRTKNKQTKALAMPSALSAALGITEPAIFGVNLRNIKAFVSAMVGAGVGAMAGSILHIGATAYGVTGIFGFLITLDYTWQYFTMLAISGASAFILTWISYSIDYKKLKV